MITHLAAGLFGLWPVIVFPVFGGGEEGAIGGAAQAGASAPSESAPRFFYSISCIEGSTGEKSFGSVDEFCTSLRAEQVCSESAAMFAFVHGCP
jgi:hypothetical protein